MKKNHVRICISPSKQEWSLHKQSKSLKIVRWGIFIKGVCMFGVFFWLQQIWQRKALLLVIPTVLDIFYQNLCDSEWLFESKKLLAAFFWPKTGFFYLSEPLEVPNPDKMSKVITNLYESRVLLLLSLFPFILMAVKLKKNKSKNDKSEIIWLPKK